MHVQQDPGTSFLGKGQEVLSGSNRVTPAFLVPEPGVVHGAGNIRVQRWLKTPAAALPAPPDRDSQDPGGRPACHAHQRATEVAEVCVLLLPEPHAAKIEICIVRHGCRRNRMKGQSSAAVTDHQTTVHDVCAA